MLPACRTNGEGFTIPTFEVVRRDVEGFMEELWEFQSAFHDCFSRSEPRAQFFDYMVGQLSQLERKSIEPMALHVAGGTIRGLQRFISDVRWDEEQMRWNYHQLVADELQPVSHESALRGRHYSLSILSKTSAGEGKVIRNRL